MGIAIAPMTHMEGVEYEAKKEDQKPWKKRKGSSKKRKPKFEEDQAQAEHYQQLMVSEKRNVKQIQKLTEEMSKIQKKVDELEGKNKALLIKCNIADVNSKIAKEQVDHWKTYEDGIKESVERYKADRDVEMKSRKRATKDSEAMSEILARHAILAFPDRVKVLRCTNSFSVSEIRNLESEVWSAMLQRLKDNSNVCNHLYFFSDDVSVNGERVLQYRKDTLLARNPPDHWFTKELRHQIIKMVIEVCHTWHIAAPWYITEDGESSLWWWRHSTKGLIQSDSFGIQTAFSLVYSNIVRRYAAYPSYRSSDKMGDDYFRDHAVAVEQIMSGMNIMSVMDELKVGITALYARDNKMG